MRCKGIRDVPHPLVSRTSVEGCVASIQEIPASQTLIALDACLCACVCVSVSVHVVCVQTHTAVTRPGLHTPLNRSPHTPELNGVKVHAAVALIRHAVVDDALQQHQQQHSEMPTTSTVQQ